MTEQDIIDAAEYADIRWSDADVPFGWLRHFVDALGKQQEERNFCPRCGKRAGKNDWDVHTCSLPEPEHCKYGYEPKSCTSDPMNCQCAHDAVLEMAEQEPVAIEYWLQDTMESGRWVTTDNMEKATAEKMLSGEYGNVYPQGRIVDPSPPQRELVGLTKDEIREVVDKFENDNGHVQAVLSFVRAIEAKLKEKNT
jgi:hypothetical protein